MSEKELIKAIKLGSEDAFIELHKLYNQHLNNVIYSKTFNESERVELVQTIWIKVFTKIHLFKEDCSFKTWLNTIAHNTFLDYLDSKKRWSSFDGMMENGDLAEESFADFNTPYVTLREKDDDFNAQKAISNLSDTHQKVLDFVIRKELTYKQAAAKMRVSIGTIESRVWYARQALKKQLKSEYERV